MSVTANRSYPIPDPSDAIHPGVRDALDAIDADLADGGGVFLFSKLRLASQSNPLIISSNAATYATYSGADESGPAIFIRRFVTTEATANEHGIVDATDFSRSAKAYASFDAQPIFSGSNNYDHFSAFQARGDHASSGTLTNYFSFISIPSRTGSGVITNLYGFYAGVGQAGAGSVTNRYSFVSESNAGNAGIGTLTPNHRLTVGANETPIGVAAIVGVYNAANCYGIFRDTTADIETVIGTDGTGSFIGSHSNHRLVLVTNNATRMVITNGGQVVIGSGSATASSALEVQSTTGAFIPPKMTTTQKNALTPTEGMQVWDTTLHEHHVYDGTAWGIAGGSAWQDWTPTLSAITIGNGTVVAKYKQLGKTVVGRIHITFGSTTTVAGGGALIHFTLPVTAATYGGSIGFTAIGWTRLWDNSAPLTYEGRVVIYDTTAKALPMYDTVSGSIITGASLTQTAPFTWATDDQINCEFMYEAA